MIKTLINDIRNSTYDKNGKVSHTKISSFFILASIIASNISFITIDMWNLFVISRINLYEIPLSHIGLYGMTLSHHLFLLGIKKWSENGDKNNTIPFTDQNKKEILND